MFNALWKTVLMKDTERNKKKEIISVVIKRYTSFQGVMGVGVIFKCEAVIVLKNNQFAQVAKFL